MKIRVSIAGGKPRKLLLCLPTRAIFSSLSATIAANVSKDELNVTSAQMRTLFREIRQSRKLLGDLPLVEVFSSDGEYIRIDL